MYKNSKFLKQLKKVEKKFDFIIGFTNWLLSFLSIDRVDSYTIKTVLSHLRKSALTRGQKDWILNSKEGRTQLLQCLDKDYSTGDTFKSFSGFWSFLNGKVRYDNIPLIRALLTVLTYSRSVRLKPEISVENISEGLKRPKALTLLLYIPGFWYELKLKKPISSSRSLYNKVGFTKFSISTKRGPNGHAMQSLIVDLKSLSEEQKQDIITLGGPRIKQSIELSSGLPKLIDGITRKIVAISDKEGKTREIAILDYWSQQVLKGLHSYLFKILSSIKQDCTFNQGSFAEKLTGSQEYNSIDLKAATDRFPIWLIQSILQYKLGVPYASAWGRIMVGTSFWSPQLSNFISYGAGNPMGAYSSWASFTLSHHFIMYVACQRSGVKWKECNYVMLGDDIVINNNIVAKAYMSILDELGVEVSPSKTHKSKNFYEFAKRYIYLGHDISPFPFNALWTNKYNPIGLLSDFCFIEQKGWHFKKSLGATFYDILGYCGSSSKRRRFFLRDFDSIHSITKFFSKGYDLTPFDVVKDLINSKITKKTLTEDIEGHNEQMHYSAQALSLNVIHDSLMNVFLASYKQVTINEHMESLSSLMIHYISDNTGAHIREVAKNNPWTDIHIENHKKLLLLSKSVWENDAIGGGIWSELFKSVVIPQDARGFFQNHQTMTIIGFSKLVNEIRDKFDLISSFYDTPRMLRNEYPDPTTPNYKIAKSKSYKLKILI